MIVRSISVNGTNISQYITRDSLSITDVKITGLSDVWTEDLVLHDDMLGYRRHLKFSLNFSSEETAQTIRALFRSSAVSVTLQDLNGSTETISCRPSMVTATMALTRGGATFWQIGNITLEERSGHNV